jgi:hypothetical protein
MTPKQQEALDRLRTQGRLSNNGYFVYDRLMPDLMTAAALALAEHPADEDVPVDEQWLSRVGFGREEHPSAWTIQRADAMPLGLWHVDDGWKAMLIHHPFAASCIVRQVNTRGAVRRLCHVLGVPLKEGGTE